MISAAVLVSLIVEFSTIIESCQSARMLCSLLLKLLLKFANSPLPKFSLLLHFNTSVSLLADVLRQYTGWHAILRGSELDGV